MAYARIPDELGIDDRYLAAIDECSAAGTIVLLGYSYAAREESDGQVPNRQLRRMLEDRDELERAIDALVSAGLWARTADGAVMLDYLHAGRNMTRAEWAAKREGERARKAKYRADKRRRDGSGDPPDDQPPNVSQRDTLGTTDGTDAGRDAGQTPDGTQESHGASLARERARGRAQIQIPKGDGGGGERADTGASVDDVADVAPLSWGPATKALITAGMSREAITRQAAEIAEELRGEARQIAWPAAGRWLRAQRNSGRLAASTDEPASALRFLLRSRGIPLVGQRPRRQPGQRQPVGETAPDGTLTAEQATELWERIRVDAQIHIGDDAWDTWLSVIRVVALDDDTLWIAAPAHASSWIEQRLGPLLRASATRVLDRPMQPIRISGRAAVSA
jgi:hypothetical protein